MADKKKQGLDLEHFSRLDAVLTVAVLLIVAGAFYYYLSVRNSSSSIPQVSAVSGSLASGFPQEYVQNGMVVLDSSVQTYPNGSKLWSASFSSDLPPASVLSGYSNLFGLLHWEITQSSNAAIYAQSGNTQVSVNAQKSGSGSQVSVSVLQK